MKATNRLLAGECDPTAFYAADPVHPQLRLQLLTAFDGPVLITGLVDTLVDMRRAVPSTAEAVDVVLAEALPAAQTRSVRYIDAAVAAKLVSPVLATALIAENAPAFTR